MKRTAREPGLPSVHIEEAPTRTVHAAGADFTYRDVGTGKPGTLPLIGLTHLGANLDSWDPEVIEPLAEGHRVILIGYRGVGASTGAVRDQFEAMAADSIAVIRALGLSRVNLFGLSMGGMVAQEILRLAPDLVDRVILASTGAPGGPGLTRMSGVMARGIARGLVTFTNPTTLLFFTRTRTGRREAKAYQSRLKWRRTGRDDRVTPGVLRAQLRAVDRWGSQLPAPSPRFTGPALILHGDSDRMVPPENVDDLMKRLPHARVRIFPDSGHGVVSQNHQAATEHIVRHLDR